MPITKKFVLPVVHHLNDQTTYDQAALALDLGADGVFLISHRGEDVQLFAPAERLKQRFPQALIGFNLLESHAREALAHACATNVDMLWVDVPGIDSRGVSPFARLLSRALSEEAPDLLFFASVAFKYQRDEPDPGLAAVNAWRKGMIPTTSGARTGKAPDVEKIQSMRDALGDGASLAIASGMTPDNVRDFLPYATHFLAATGVSDDEHHFSPRLLADFIREVSAPI